MITKPAYNAILAIGYINLLVMSLWWGGQIAQNFIGTEDNIFMPIAMLALLCLSVSIMAFLFFYQPVILLLEGKREQAAKFFLHTVAYFAGAIAIVILTALVVGILA